MRLINFGTGEIVDRLSILQLKILQGKPWGRSVDHLEAERDELRRTLLLPGCQTWYHLAIDLSLVNAISWRLGDQLRVAGAKGDMETAGRAAYEQLLLNDQRAELIDRINKVTGQYKGPEKL